MNSSSSSSSTYVRSSSSSSSTYIRSSSSSSSSRLDYHDNRTIPFIFEVEVVNPIWTFAFNGEDVYAGTGSDGIVLKSTDRVFWSNIYQVDDIHVTALYSQSNNLFIGTSPSGKIYIMDVDAYDTILSAILGGTIYDFCYFQNKMYVAGGIPSQIYVYNDTTSKWDTFYQPYTGKINKLFYFYNKMYAIMDGSNIVSFDGITWTLEPMGIDNLSSFRGVSTDPYSQISNNLVSRSTIITTDGMNDEEIYDVFPLRYATGIKSIDSDQGSLILGTSNYGEVYNYTGSNLYRIFQTESQNTVHSILNVFDNVNLAAIDSKLYLIHCGSEISDTTASEFVEAVPTSTNTTTTRVFNNVINITNPTGGETYTIGDVVNIRWTSEKSLNDPIKIELYNETVLNTVIDEQTVNDGSYEWTIPSITAMDDYRIVLTWLSASTDQSANQSSSGNFTILLEQANVTTTTTTTLMPTEESWASYSNCAGIPVLDLDNGEYITTMAKDVAKGGILFATSNGRIFGCSELTVNAYLTGNRRVYAEVKDGFGNTSDTAWTSFLYALYHKIVEINSDKEIVKWQFEVDPTTIVADRITGIFLSPIMNIKEDMGQWKQLIWKEEKPSNTDIVICVRAATSIEELKTLSWDYCFTSRDSDREYGSIDLITRDLKDYQLKGRYIQFKVVMTSDSRNVSPSLINLSITYTTNFSIYFFTTKFSLQNSSGVQSGLMVASITEPQNTKVKFGITDLNSADWNDYQEVELNKLFELNKIEDIKVGIKMVSYDENIPEVAEFALLAGADKDNEINEL